MSIREELGLTRSQFDKLKKELLLEIMGHKPKQYWKTMCPRCNGSGSVVETGNAYRVFERLQDEDLGCVLSTVSLEQADQYVAERRQQPLGSSSMLTIVAPNGEVVQ
jgi:hypothetical protein